MMRATIAALILAAGAASAQDVASGEKLYYDYLCYSCHGYNGTALRRPLTNDLSGIMANETVFIAFLRQRADMNPETASNSMPNYSAATLSDRQARDLYAYINQFEDNPPEVKDDPLMQEILDATKARDPAGE
jgi:cytochrome c553